jgi:hypothetical protein
MKKQMTSVLIQNKNSNDYITENGIIFERVISQKIPCEFYFFSNKKHKCTMSSIKPDPNPQRYTCNCNKQWKYCDVP